MRTPLRLVLMGMMGQSPLGGQTWMHLNWIRGFQRLGHDVWYVEDSTAWPYDPVQNTVTDECSMPSNTSLAAWSVSGWATDGDIGWRSGPIDRGG